MKTKELLLTAGRLALDLARSSRGKNSTSVLPPGIVHPGEKVIAIETHLNIDGTLIKRGEILTVESYHLGSYRFKERSAYYDPYLGEMATPWYSVTSFRIPDEASARIISFLDEVEASAKACCKQMFEAVETYQPATQLKLLSSRKDFEAFLNEYEVLIMQFDLLLKERIEQIEQENLLLLLQNCQAREERDAFSLNANSSLRRLRYEFRNHFNSRCEHAFPDSAAWASKSVQEKMRLLPRRNKVLAELAQSIRESFSAGISRSHFDDGICNQYADYIIRYV